MRRRRTLRVLKPGETVLRVGGKKLKTGDKKVAVVRAKEFPEGSGGRTMSPRLSDIAPKLQKLVLMLSSDQPGEVAAAAAAIKRALQAAGADFHDLARELTKPSAPPAQPTSAAYERPYWAYRHDDESWQAMHAFCKHHMGRLTAREQGLMETLDGWRGTPTEKQQSWLKAIHARLRR
jgi:hypothetical protein